MDAVKFEFLDIPIIRSCNLECAGCLTFSDSKKIHGLVNLEESRSWLEFWSSKLSPTIVTVFGGEPLLHPDFIGWCRAIKQYWPNSKLRINTNGYYLDRLFTQVDNFFTEELSPKIIVSVQTASEPYQSMVKNNAKELMDLIQKKYSHRHAFWDLWKDEQEISKQWWRLIIDRRPTHIWITVSEQHKSSWQAHYQGREQLLKPFYDYNDVHYVENHRECQAAPFVNLYKGKLYKCPTTAVLEHTLETFQLLNSVDWKDYLTLYNSIDTNATDTDIINWFNSQKTPEKVCNMCGFSGPLATSGHLNNHELKLGWKFKQI